MKVAITGISGRMGHTLIEAIQQDDRFSLVAAFTQEKSEEKNTRLVENLNLTPSPLLTHDFSELLAANPEVLIDFSAPQATLSLLAPSMQVSLPLIIGTTGFTETQKLEISKASQTLPIVLAPNFSVGVTITFALVALAARSLSPDYDAEIIDAHHRYKVDAPSGTALKIGEVIAKERGVNLDKVALFERHGQVGTRQGGTIGFSSIRAGDIVGDHTALFASDSERLEITHRASSRLTFAKGALHAALWLLKQKPGLYDMQDVLGLKTFFTDSVNN